MTDLQSIIEVEAPSILNELNKFIDLNKLKMGTKEECLIYALAQLLQDKLEQMDGTPEYKGGTALNIIESLQTLNDFNIQFYKKYLDCLAKQKTSTIH